MSADRDQLRRSPATRRSPARAIVRITLRQVTHELLAPALVIAVLANSAPAQLPPLKSPLSAPVLEPGPQRIPVLLATELLMKEPSPECGAAPKGWPDLLTKPKGVTPADVRLTPTGSFSAEITWRGAPWAVSHEVLDLTNTSGFGVPAQCYMEWGLPVAEPVPAPTGERQVVVDAPLRLEVASAPPPPGLVAMARTVAAPCYARTYRYKVVAHYADSAPAWSPEMSLTTPAAPAAPPFGRLDAQGSVLRATLTWARLADAIEYRVYRNGVRIADGERIEKLKARYDAYRQEYVWPDTTYSEELAAGNYTYRVEARFATCSYAPGPSGEPLSSSDNVPVQVKAPPRVWCRRRPP